MHSAVISLQFSTRYFSVFFHTSSAMAEFVESVQNQVPTMLPSISGAISQQTSSGQYLLLSGKQSLYHVSALHRFSLIWAILKQASRQSANADSTFLLEASQIHGDLYACLCKVVIGQELITQPLLLQLNPHG